MRRTIGLLFLASFFFAYSVAGHAAPTVSMEFPRGRFQENNVPTFFRWTLTKPVTTISVKIYKLNDDGSYDVSRNLLARFDVTGGTQSLNWPKAPFGHGQYVWALEGYDDKSSLPIMAESAKFQIEKLNYYDLRARRAGALLGFSRGSYSSQDPNLDIKIDTTPTNYGAFIHGGSEEKIWDVSLGVSDYILRGSLKRSMIGSAYRAGRIWGTDSISGEVFAGPSFRLANIPCVRSPDGYRLTTTQVIYFNPGLVFLAQKGLDYRTTAFAQALIDLPVYSTSPANPEFSKLSLNTSVGILFGGFWPLGVGAELRYKSEKYNSKQTGQEVTIGVNEWSALGNLVYTY